MYPGFPTLPVVLTPFYTDHFPDITDGNEPWTYIVAELASPPFRMAPNGYPANDATLVRMTSKNRSSVRLVGSETDQEWRATVLRKQWLRMESPKEVVVELIAIEPLEPAQDYAELAQQLDERVVDEDVEERMERYGGRDPFDDNPYINGDE